MASVRLGDKRRALVRGISDGFEDALAQYFGSGPTDLPTARAQHDAYVKALKGAGVEVIELPADQRTQIACSLRIRPSSSMATCSCRPWVPPVDVEGDLRSPRSSPKHSKAA